MRKIRGWIRNLADGLGPPPGSVQVHARPDVDNAELDLEDHDLGALSVTHLVGGSSSITDADAGGHFGWDMELSPGPITTQVVPTDPQTEYRYRFPDESAQIGKAFHSDLERLGWAAGRDTLIWGAIEGAVAPTAATWSADPLVSSGLGDWSIAGYGTGATAGRVTLRRGIAFLGGVVFSIEAGDLVVPLASEPAIPANAAGSERWDLLILAMDIDPISLTYGKQSIVVQQGVAGGGIPALIPVAGSRRMVVHALKMAAGASDYSATYDLRPWKEPVSRAIPGLAISTIRSYVTGATDGVESLTSSSVNSLAALDEVILPLDSAYAGTVTFLGNLNEWITDSIGFGLNVVATTEGRSVAGGTVVSGSDYIYAGAAHVLPILNSGLNAWNHFSIPFAVRRIPSGAEGRTWHRLRAVIRHSANGPLLVGYPSMIVNLWPVP